MSHEASLLIPSSISRVSHLLHSDGDSPVFYDLNGSTSVTSPSFLLACLVQVLSSRELSDGPECFLQILVI